MKWIFLFVGTILIFGCGYNKKNKKHHIFTHMVCNHLFIEGYNVYADGGAIGGSMLSSYLTDSSNFRIYLGTFDEADVSISGKCNGDTINIFEVAGRSTGKITVIKKRAFKLQNLKKKHLFE